MTADIVYFDVSCIGVTCVNMSDSLIPAKQRTNLCVVQLVSPSMRL